MIKRISPVLSLLLILFSAISCSSWKDLSERAVIDLKELEKDPNFCQGQVWQLLAPKSQLDLQVVEETFVITFRAEKVPIFRRAYEEVNEPLANDYLLGFELVNTHIDDLFINWNESYFVGPDGQSSRLYPIDQELSSLDQTFNFSKIPGNGRVSKTILPLAYLKSESKGIVATNYQFRQMPGKKVGIILSLQRHMRTAEQFAYQFQICAH